MEKLNKFVAFSGGVDSTALALLMPNATPVFTDTGWEFPEVYQHIEKFEKKTGREVVRIKSKYGSLPDYIRKTKFFPGHGSRYCTRLFKIEPYNEFIRQHLPAVMMIGLRADEPERVGNLTEIEGMQISYPLREKGLNRLDVVKICTKNDLLPRYPVYMARGGCIGCFYKRKSEVTALLRLKPDVAAELAKLENEIQGERGKFSFMFPNISKPVEYIAGLDELFEPEEVYASAQQNDDVGVECGLFCNR